MEVMLKEGVLDAHGQTTEKALHSLGYAGVSNVTLGKCIEMDVESPDSAAAQTEVKGMAEKLLANPVVESYRFEVLPLGADGT
ncbi:MAG TPA: phosphoribosylformylglycinamidine synthase subunit PurS [Candidatus Xenobia bacterium]|jgi:phosphoribosylformylglycinamidine synthase